MKSNIHKIGQSVLKALEKHGKVLVVPTSHNALNQLDIALKRVGIHGDPNWTPRLAHNTVTNYEKFNKRDGHPLNSKRARLIGKFDDPSMQATVKIAMKDGKYYSQVHNHNCDLTIVLTFSG